MQVGLLTEDVFRSVERSGTIVSSTLTRITYGDEESKLEAELDWATLADDAFLLYAWSTNAVARFERFARNNVTSGPAAALCRAVLTGLHSDDVGGGAHYSPAATQMLHRVVSEARALQMPIERALALQVSAPRSYEERSSPTACKRSPRRSPLHAGDRGLLALDQRAAQCARAGAPGVRARGRRLPRASVRGHAARARQVQGDCDRLPSNAPNCRCVATDCHGLPADCLIHRHSWHADDPPRGMLMTSLIAR